jgi:hypothetical protein
MANPIHIDRSKGARKTNEDEWSLEKLRLDPQNVRFKHLEKLMSDSQIEDYIWQESDTKDLFRSIVASGGLSEKPFVTADGVVKEGNRRLVCLRKAREAVRSKKIEGLAPDTFDKVTVDVFEEGITPAEMDLWLARVHVSGKKQWGALNQASHLFGLYNDRGYSYEQIRELLGMGKAEVMRKIQSYKATRDYLKQTGGANITDYSFFEELYKKRELGILFDGDKTFRENIYKWIKAGKFDETGAKDMRFLMDVLKDSEAKAAFEKRGMKAARHELNKKNPALGDPVFKAIDSALTALKNMPRETLKNLSENKSQIALLKALGDEIKLVLDEV